MDKENEMESSKVEKGDLGVYMHPVSTKELMMIPLLLLLVE